MKKTQPFLKFIRIIMSFVLRVLPVGRLSDILIWPVSKRIFSSGYSEVVFIDKNIKMRVYGDMPDMINKSLLFMSGYKFLAWEPVTARLVKFLAPKLKSAVIAGSHIGYYPIIVAGNNPNAVIYAFEPNPIIYKRLKENILINNFLNIKTNELALGDQESKKKMYFDSGQSSLIDSLRKHSDSGIVNITTIDHFFSKNSPDPDLMIFDAEGYEPHILLGAQNVIRRATPDIIFEINPQMLQFDETDKYKFLNMLKNLGYTLFKINDDYENHFNNIITPKISFEPFNSAIPFSSIINIFSTIHPERFSKFIHL